MYKVIRFLFRIFVYMMMIATMAYLLMICGVHLATTIVLEERKIRLFLSFNNLLFAILNCAIYYIFKEGELLFNRRFDFVGNIDLYFIVVALYSLGIILTGIFDRSMFDVLLGCCCIIVFNLYLYYLFLGERSNLRKSRIMAINDVIIKRVSPSIQRLYHVGDERGGSRHGGPFQRH